MTLFGSSSSSSNNQASRVPPGFRFHPTDEELVGYYLQKKVASKKIDLDVIHEIDLYKLEPWDLHERCKIGSAEQSEWYFFSHKDKKYPTGTRTNRATAAGFWKATGRDKAIHAKFKLIGMRKTLVFYKGRAPNGQKSDWIMHEYRLEDEHANNNNDDGWVVCRVFKKRSTHKFLDRDVTCCYDDQIALLPELESPGGDLQPYNQNLVNCKQEFDPEVYVPMHHDPFSHLPRLESPRLSSIMAPLPPSTTSSLIKGFLQQSHLGMRDFSPPTFEAPPLPPGERSTLFGQAQAKFPAFNSEPVTDWRMVDRLAAAQLSNEGEHSKERYSTSATHGASNNNDLPSAEDVELLCRLSKHASTSSSSDFNNNNAEGDLWSFGR